MNIKIKKLGKEDIEEAIALAKVQESENGQGKINISKEKLKERIANKNFHVLVAIEETKVIGGLIAHTLPMFNRAESKIFLYEIDVQKEYRRKGIASKLIVALKKLSKDLNAKSIFLCTEPENIAAQKLYEKLGGKTEIASMYIFEL